jgi:acetyl esterase/lipase
MSFYCCLKRCIGDFVLALALVAAAGAAGGGALARPPVWQPDNGRMQVALWPGAAPDAASLPGPEAVSTSSERVGGKRYALVSNVSEPTLTLYPARGTPSGAAVVVAPGGGFRVLAIDLEGTEACDWFTTHGIACVLLKYRVPGLPYDWQCKCRPDNRAISLPSLQDMQRAMRLVRHNAEAWQIDPHRVGVLGFSAGGYIAAEISTLFDRDFYAPVDAADAESARPDFALLLYPGHLVEADGSLNHNLPVSAATPPTFLAHAENDDVDHVEQSQVYYDALSLAGVPAELHLYAHGGHAFGLRQATDAGKQWPTLAVAWLHKIHVLLP